MIDWDKAVQGPSMDVFGEPVRYMPATRAPFNTLGTFQDAARGIPLAGGMDVTSTQPNLGVRLSQFPNPPEQDDRLIIIRTRETFIVKEVLPDGIGAARLMLNLDI